MGPRKDLRSYMIMKMRNIFRGSRIELIMIGSLLIKDIFLLTESFSIQIFK